MLIFRAGKNLSAYFAQGEHTCPHLIAAKKTQERIKEKQPKEYIRMLLMNRCYYLCKDRCKGRQYALFVVCSTAKLVKRNDKLPFSLFSFNPKVYFYLGYHSLVIILDYGITSMFLKRTHYTYFVSPSTLERFSKALVIVVQKP